MKCALRLFAMTRSTDGHRTSSNSASVSQSVNWLCVIGLALLVDVEGYDVEGGCFARTFLRVVENVARDIDITAGVHGVCHV